MNRLRNKNLLLRLVFLLFILIPFQNCLDQKKNGSSNAPTPLAGNLTGGGNGSGYDGKLTFVNFGSACSSISSGSQSLMPANVIEVSDDHKSAVQTVRDCQPLNPAQPVDISTLLTYNPGLILPNQQIYDSAPSASEPIATKDISEIACRIDGLQIRPYQCNVGNCYQDSFLSLDLQMTPVLTIYRGSDNKVQSAFRKVKLNMGLYNRNANVIQDDPIAVIRDAVGSTADRPVQSFKPLSFFDNFLPSFFNLDLNYDPYLPGSLNGKKMGYMHTYQSDITTTDFDGKVEYTLSAIPEADGSYDYHNIYLSYLKITFVRSTWSDYGFMTALSQIDQVNQGIFGNNTIEYRPYLKCNTQ